jgi:hypothetical protein
MDIKRFAVQPTSKLHLRDASDNLMYADDAQTLPIAVNLYGPGSKQYAKAQTKQANNLMDKYKRKGKAEQTAEQRVAENADFLSDLVASWENLEYDQLTGRDLSVAVFSDQSIGFISDQISKFVSEWSNFTQNSTTN